MKLVIFGKVFVSHLFEIMRKLLLFCAIFLAANLAMSQTDDCFKRLEDAFTRRGAYAVPDDMYRNVIVSFFEDGGSYCYSGKARVVNGAIRSIFVQYKDDSYELFLDGQDIYDANKKPVTVKNGISDMIVTSKGERLRIVFIDKLKPKPQVYKQAVIPNDL